MAAETIDFQEVRKKRDRDREVSASPDHSDYHDKTKSESSQSHSDILLVDGKTVRVHVEKVSPVYVMRGFEHLSEEQKKKYIESFRRYPEEVLEVVELSTGRVLEYS